MDVRFLGTGGARGWPEAGCRCASCMRARAAGRSRRPAAVLVDGRLRIDAGQPPRPAGAAGSGAADSGAASSGAASSGAASSGAGSSGAGYRIGQLPGGWDITAPDGRRLLVAAAPGMVPDPPAGTRPYDMVLLDLLHSAPQLGALRALGLAGDNTIVAALYADHRMSSEQEFARRCRIWRAAIPGDGDILSTGAGPGGSQASPVQASPVPASPAPASPVPASPVPHRTLILGGARSGKSREAELRLAAEPEVTYLAAGPWAGDSWTGADGSPDAEWAQRVAAHQARRPAWWRTLESTDVAGALCRLRGAVLVDGIGTWLAAVMDEAGAWRAAQDGAPQDGAPQDGAAQDGAATADAAAAEEKAAARIAARVDELVAAWRETSARVVAVSDQVGSGVVPATPAGRQFRDQLGWLNQRLAAESEDSVLVIAGRVLSLPT